jgi:hypothetical protein
MCRRPFSSLSVTTQLDARIAERRQAIEESQTPSNRND